MPRVHATALGLVLLASACGGAKSGNGTGSVTGTGTGTGGSTSVGGQGGETGGGGDALQAVHFVGRFDATQRSSWPGSSYRARVSGGDATLTLDAPAGIHFEVEVDGVSQGSFVTTQGEQSYPLMGAPATGEHDLLVHRRVEGLFGTTRFVGLEPPSGGAIVPSAWPYEHRVEFIGDSYTAGYGALGPDQTCYFTAETESSYVTYAQVAARAVNAAAHLIAYSGKGAFQNYGNDQGPRMPELYLRTIADDPAPWPFADAEPEAVVVSLGTNDFSSPIAESDFVNAYVGLLTTVRQRRPNATIFAVRWENWDANHMGWVTNAVTQHGDDNTVVVDFGIDPADGWGCDYHPSAATHAKLGAQLAATFQSELGW